MSQITINLGAVAANYRAIQSCVGGNCRVAGVVKANAYGCGVAAIAPILVDVGCDLFFVATLPEAIELRMIIGDDPQIAMLNGYDKDEAALYTENAIIPVINHRDALDAYKSAAHKLRQPLPAILHIDTGMNRLGFDAESIQTLRSDADAFAGLDMLYYMSHFSSAEDHNSPQNTVQVTRFEDATAILPKAPKSLCNSGGVYNDSCPAFAMVRPGMALYGLNPTPHAPNPMQPVVSISTKILQTKTVEAGESCGYNETYRFDIKSSVAIVSIGYADGFLRSLSNAGKLYYKGIPCPIVGRVSMDLSIVDLSAIPDGQTPKAGDTLEVIGAHQSADALAESAGTIGYEVLTGLSRRFERNYLKP